MFGVKPSEADVLVRENALFSGLLRVAAPSRLENCSDN